MNIDQLILATKCNVAAVKVIGFNVCHDEIGAGNPGMLMEEFGTEH
jgi:hypothetical protein